MEYGAEEILIPSSFVWGEAPTVVVVYSVPSPPGAFRRRGPSPGIPVDAAMQGPVFVLSSEVSFGNLCGLSPQLPSPVCAGYEPGGGT